MTNAEVEFIQKIDCRFPYDEIGLAEALVDEGCQISANSAFMIVHELARRPRSCQTTDGRCLELLDRVDRQFHHPLKDLVVPLARRMIHKAPIAIWEAVEAMEVVGRFTGQMNALSVAYCSPTDHSDELDMIYDKIVATWKLDNPPLRPTSGNEP
jgi:hypothetical protein